MAGAEVSQPNPDGPKDAAPAVTRKKSIGWKFLAIVEQSVRWLRFSRFGQRLPRVADGLIRIEHEAIQRRHLRAMRAGERPSDLDIFHVPDQEHVHFPAIWVVEMFPPSESGALAKAIKRNRWEARTVKIGFTEPNLRSLEKARDGTGYTWWDVANLAQVGKRSPLLDARKVRLPDAFDGVELVAMQVGGGVTALVACFHLNETVSTRLDAIWHSDHRPEMSRPSGKWPVPQAAKWVAFKRTQQSRDDVHKQAREWLAKKAPGVFAASKLPQPLVGCLVLDEYNPMPGDDAPSSETNDHLRALGIDASQYVTALQLPGLLLDQPNGTIHPHLETRATWTLWGQRGHFFDNVPNLDSHGGESDSTITHLVHDRARNTLLQLANGEMVRLLQSRFAKVRDSARIQNKRTSPQYLKNLRESLLTLSLDVSSIASDVTAFNKVIRKVRYTSDAQFVATMPPWIDALDRQLGRTPEPPRELSRDLRKQQARATRELVAADQETRSILAAASSISASLQSLQAGRVARWIAAASLSISLITFLLASTTGDSRFDGVVDWLRDSPQSQPVDQPSKGFTDQCPLPVRIDQPPHDATSE